MRAASMYVCIGRHDDERFAYESVDIDERCVYESVNIDERCIQESVYIAVSNTSMGR